MTSAPVKSVNSLMNFVGTRANVQNSKMSDGSFGSAMNRATGENSRSDAGKQTTLLKCTNRSNTSDVPKNISSTDSKGPVGTRDSLKSIEESVERIEDSGKELVDQVAEVFGVTQEEVLEAMEVLGLSYLSILEPGNLQELVLQVCGEADASALLTNEGLFENLQTLNQLTDDMRQELMQEMNFTPEELEQLLEGTKTLSSDAAMGEEAVGLPDMEAEADEQLQEPRITIDVKVNGRNVKMEAEENGSVVKTLETAPNEVKEQDGQRSQSEDSNKQEHHAETSLHSENLMLNEVLQERVSVEETSFVQTTASYDGTTQEIMDQILNYMKIQLKPGMEQLEMQLHPENLGTVHVQLTSKGGEITAEFHVQNESVKAALESQITELKESFREQGMKVEAVEVSVDARGFESNLWQGQERQDAYENNRKPLRRMNLNRLDALFEEEASEEELLNVEVMEMNGSTVDYTV